MKFELVISSIYKIEIRQENKLYNMGLIGNVTLKSTLSIEEYFVFLQSIYWSMI